ncbi:amidase [Aureobasidium subglaciale]|nr:amidase [Aureobasidium subglaciale]
MGSEDWDDVYFMVADRKRESQQGIPDVFHVPQCEGNDVFELSADELQHLLSTGAMKSVSFVKHCLERIRRVNPYLECVIETNPDALEIAQQLDDERANGKTRGPLHGIPVLVKDNMATKDKMQTTGGSWALLGAIVPKDAHIVHLLRKSGAIILGHSNLDEWAGMRSKIYSNGYSARGGQTRNPYMLSRSPQGSSSGSAVSVSANIVPLAFGTETDTSVIWPAMVSGIVGIKPTVGLTSRSGVIPISETQDSIGTYGRCVSDAARALDAIAGPDPEDKHSVVPERRQPKSYVDSLTTRKALYGARFGLPIRRFWELVPKQQRKVAEKVLQLIKNAGAKIIPVEMPCAEERIAPDGGWDWEHGKEEVSEFTINKVECYYLMNDYLSRLKNTHIKTVEDVVRFNDENSGSQGANTGDHPAFPSGQDNFREVVEAKGIKTTAYYSALHHMRKQCRENGIDAALSPTINGKKTSLDALLFCDVRGAGQQIAAQALITIPIGLDPDGIPIGLNLQHTAWQEATLIYWASAIEDLVHAELGPRNPPRYQHYLAKNVPVENEYRYPGAPPRFGDRPPVC